MSTPPAVEYVPSDPKLLETLGRFADVLQEIVNFGTHVLEWELEASNGDDNHVPIALSTRHILELLDSVSINIRHSCVDPCKLLLRGALESLFSVMYILEDDTARRAMAFLAYHATLKLKMYKRLDPNTDEGKKFNALLSNDRILHGRNLSIPPSIVESSILNMESLLRTKGYRDAHAELLRTKKAGSRNPYWYSLYGGPKNLEELASHLRLSALYQTLYRQWSGATHGTDIIQGKIAGRADGKAAILQFRLPTDAQTLTAISISMGLELFEVALKHYAPGKMDEFRVWYTHEIHSVHMKLAGGKIIQMNL